MTTRREVVLALVIVCLGPVAVAQQDAVALRNWSAPPYWLPSAATPAGGTQTAEGPGVAAEPAVVRALPLVAIAPCRLLDTRMAGLPALLPGVAQEITVVGRCGIPAQAQGVSLRLVVSEGTGSGVLTLGAAGEVGANGGRLVLDRGRASSTAGVVGLDTSGLLMAVTEAGSLQLVVEVNGYYAAEPAVRSLNGLAGDVILQAGENVAITSGGSAVTIAAVSGSHPAVEPSAGPTQPVSGKPAQGTAQGPAQEPRVKRVLPRQPGTIRVRAQALLPPPSSMYVAGALELPNTTAVGAGALTLGGNPFLHNYAGPGSEGGNTFVGPGAGNLTMGWSTYTWEGSYNTASGYQSLRANTTGAFNTATGFESLGSNTTGYDNTASGYQSLYFNTTGFANTANGYQSLYSNITGAYNAANGGRSLSSNTSGINNTASGFWCLFSNTTGSGNTASGEESLSSNTTGDNNTAIGFDSLLNNTTGTLNTAIGHGSLFSNTTASWNTASGYASLNQNTTGYENAANGVNSLLFNTTGHDNTASGVNSLSYNTTGSYNIGVGNMAGYNLTTGSYNIDIANQGVAAEANTIRIGDSNQTRAFIAGIRGATTGNQNAIPVLIDSNGQLGTVSSSRRFKKDIRDMGEASSRLLELHPVSFRYIGQTEGIHFGLIAEEVAEVLPELVVHDATGQVETVAYHEMPAMLLNELKKQKAQIEAQGGRIEAQQAKLEAQQVQIETLKARLAEQEYQLQVLMDERIGTKARAGDGK